MTIRAISLKNVEKRTIFEPELKPSRFGVRTPRLASLPRGREKSPNLAQLGQIALPGWRRPSCQITLERLSRSPAREASRNNSEESPYNVRQHAIDNTSFLNFTSKTLDCLSTAMARRRFCRQTARFGARMSSSNTCRRSIKPPNRCRHYWTTCANCMVKSSWTMTFR